MPDNPTTAHDDPAERLRADLKALIADTESLLRATQGQAGEKVDELRTRLNASLDAAKATFHKLEDRAIATAKSADRVIRDHPYESMGVALGVGLLVGVLISRK